MFLWLHLTYEKFYKVALCAANSYMTIKNLLSSQNYYGRIKLTFFFG